MQKGKRFPRAVVYTSLLVDVSNFINVLFCFFKSQQGLFEWEEHKSVLYFLLCTFLIYKKVNVCYTF